MPPSSPAAPHLRLRQVLSAVLVFGGLAIWSTYPLILQLGSVVPGGDPSDNVASLWNTWWFHHAMQTGAAVYRTSSLFAPLGTQLSLHTHATTHSVLAWPWTLITGVVTAHNLAIVTGLTLNGICTFVLAHRLTGRFVPSVAAGWLFAASAFVHLHLLGHMNLIHAWVVPLFVMALAGFTSSRSVGAAIWLGTTAAITMYTDYYFAVYCVLIGVIWTVIHVLAVSADPPRRRFGRAGRVLLVLAGLALVAAAAIAASGGSVVEVAGVRVSLRSARNPLALAWLLALAAAVCFHPARPRVSWRVRPDGRSLVVSGLALAVAAALSLPVVAALVDVVRSGEYASQRILWRSSPAGADTLTMILGHPRHALTGSSTRAAYDALGIDVIEQSLWLGCVPIVLVAAWRRRWFGGLETRSWLVIGAVFVVLSLGPFLRVAGRDTGIPLPYAALRYLPVFSNARMPGRAVIVVELAVAMLLAIGWSRRRPAATASAGLVALVLLESLPGPSALYRLPGADRVDAELTRSPDPGAVVELPTGVRDGFGYAGDFDHRALVHQMVHGRPLAGGFVARLAPSIAAHYDWDPVLSRFVHLSRPGGPAIELAPDLAAGAAARGLRFVVVNRDRLEESRLSRASLEAAGFRFVLADGPRELFATSSR